MLTDQLLPPILMAVLATNLLIILLTFCFCNTKIMINAGYKLLALFIIFAVLRFLLPIELPFTISLYWSESVSSFILKLYPLRWKIVGHSFALGQILICLWVIGIVVNFIHYCVTYLRSRYYIILHAKVITHKEPYASIMDKICKEANQRNNFTLLAIPDIACPVLYGTFKPRILIPEHMELSNEDWYYVLQHEASHHFHHDIPMKNIIKFITMIYWWNPFCITLNKKTDVILEMRVDDALTLKDVEATDRYLQCLVDVSEHAIRTKAIPKVFTMSLLPKELSDTRKRFSLLVANQKKKRISLNIFLFSIALVIFLLSYTFIVEAFYPPREVDSNPKATYDEMVLPVQNDTKAIQNPDGTYDIYLNGDYLDTLDSLEYFLDIEIYSENERPE